MKMCEIHDAAPKNKLNKNKMKSQKVFVSHAVTFFIEKSVCKKGSKFFKILP